eukprot:2211270-Alexandrium_andersonii.AAC.1
MHVNLFWRPGVLGPLAGLRYREAVETFVELQRLSTFQLPDKADSGVVYAWLSEELIYLGFARCVRTHQQGGAAGPSYRWAEHISAVTRVDLPDSDRYRYRIARRLKCWKAVFLIVNSA